MESPAVALFKGQLVSLASQSFQIRQGGSQLGGADVFRLVAVYAIIEVAQHEEIAGVVNLRLTLGARKEQSLH